MFTFFIFFLMANEQLHILHLMLKQTLLFTTVLLHTATFKILPLYSKVSQGLFVESVKRDDLGPKKSGSV